MRKDTQDFLNYPPVEIQGQFDGRTSESLDEVRKELEHLAQRSAWLLGYFHGREFGRDHATAVKVANRKLTAVRKGLGFVYPDSANIDV